MPMSIKLDPEIEKRYGQLAERTGRSKSFYVRLALESEIDELEETYDILRTVEEVRSGKQATRPLSEVMADYGL